MVPNLRRRRSSSTKQATTGSSSGPSVEVIARTFTWSHDSKGLFDYEAKSVFKRNYRAKMCDEGFVVNRTNCDVQMVPASQSEEDEEALSPMGSAATVANAGLDSSASPLGRQTSSIVRPKSLLKLYEREGTYWVEAARQRGSQDGEGYSSDSSAGANGPVKLWQVIRHTKGAGHRLAEGDVLKLGRFKIRVKEIVTTEEEAEERRRAAEQDTRDRELSDDRASAMTVSTEIRNGVEDEVPVSERVCRICYDVAEKENPLVAPCTCKGSMKYIHLKCLRQWMDGRLCLRPDPYGSSDRDGHPLANSYFWRSLDCELCKTSYPSVVEYPAENGRIRRVDLYVIPRPAPPYIILESKIKHHSSRRSSNSSESAAPQKGLHIMSLGNNPRETIRVGRGHDADVRINDISVSRCHAVVRLVPGGRGKRPYFVLEDQKSKFGTLVRAPNPLRLEVSRGIIDFNASAKKTGPKPAQGCLTLQQGRSVIQLQLRRPSVIQKVLACGGSSGADGMPGKVTCTLSYAPPTTSGPLTVRSNTPRRDGERRTAQDRARTDFDLPEGEDECAEDAEDPQPISPSHSLPQAVEDCEIPPRRSEAVIVGRSSPERMSEALLGLLRVAAVSVVVASLPPILTPDRRAVTIGVEEWKENQQRVGGVEGSIMASPSIAGSARSHSSIKSDGFSGVFNVTSFTAHSDRVVCCRLGAASGHFLATGGEDRRVNVWRLEKAGNSALMSLNGHSSPVSCVVFDRQEEIIASGCTGGGIKVWDVATSKMVSSLPGHKTECTTVEFHPYGSFFATASADTNIKIWDLRQQKCVQIYRGHHFGAATNGPKDGRIGVVRFSPHGKWLVGGGGDGSVRLWDLSAGKLLKDMEQSHRDAVTSLDFHPADFYLISSSQDRTCKLWNCDTFSLAGTSELDQSAVKLVKFRPDGSSLLHASQDALKVFSWDPESCRIACEAVHPLPSVGDWQGAADMRVSSSSASRAVVVSLDGTQVRVWRLNHLDEPIDKTPRAPPEPRRLRKLPSLNPAPAAADSSPVVRHERPKTAITERSQAVTQSVPLAAESARSTVRRCASPRPSPTVASSPNGSASSSTLGEEHHHPLVKEKRHKPRQRTVGPLRPSPTLSRQTSLNDSDLASNKSPKSSPSSKSAAARSLRPSVLSNPSFLKSLRKQLSAVRKFKRLWLEEIDETSALDICCKGDKNSPALIVGMLDNVFHVDKSYVVTLAQCQKTLLPELRLVCGRPETRETAMAAVRTLLRNFGALIIATRSAGTDGKTANGQFASIHRMLAAEQHLRHRSPLPADVLDTMNELERFIAADNSSSNIEVNPNGR
ncbi:Katanin p80 (WD repeat containing) subunit B 1 [Perkinsus chesapeaki]|uniref:Katanin p80 (WD repeat containing) subunit B 1 n=1 Tax=Perkinsus chesapeaki TaxID=330153 RepID=A0A7J6MXT0_PERCH|nr:Katanin p80 (WD repeat containing) subunit B 1 [Perkinsus chesapeaki]